MRPKKRIVLIDALEARRSVLVFTLRTAGWAVDPACSPAEAELAPIPHVLVVAAPFDLVATSALLERYRAGYPETGFIVVADSALDLWPVADPRTCIWMLHGNPSRILEECKFLARRKRGPQKRPAVVAGALAKVGAA